MKPAKMISIAIATLLCIGFISVFAADASAEDDPLQEGYAYGYSYKIDKAAIEKELDMNLTDMINGVLEGILEEDEDVASIINGLTVDDLNFSLALAAYMEVVKADDTGYIIDYGFGFGADFSIAVTVSGMFPKAGTYASEDDIAELEQRSVKFSFSVSFGVAVFASFELDADGELVSITLDASLRFSASLKMGMTIQFKDDGSFVLSYKNSEYAVGINAALCAKLLFEPVEDSECDEVAITADSLSLTGGVTISKDLKALIDSVIEEGYVDNNLLNMTTEDGIKILTDGKFGIDLADLTDEEKTTVMERPAGLTLEELTDTSNLDIFGQLMGNEEFATLLEEAGLTELFESLLADLEASELDEAQLKDVKGAIEEIKEGNEEYRGPRLVFIFVLVVVCLVLVAILALLLRNKV